MADSSSSSSSSLLPSYQPVIKVILILSSIPYALGCFTSIFSFGDSLTDTGNLYTSCLTRKEFYHFCNLPYGETYFHHSVGRCSDGRLVIDFIAESLGLPLVKPYLGNRNWSVEEIKKGVNFAVVGATALDVGFFEEKGISISMTNDSLGIQLEWFKQIRSSLCNTSSKCDEILRTSLILVGEIGGNDYNDPFFTRRSFEEIQTFVPYVIKAISSTISELVNLGAKTLVVPGNLPIGCSAAYLTYYQTEDKTQYDPQTGCLNWLNEFSEYHNEQLQKELHLLRLLHPHATIIYADYYNAAMPLYRSPVKFGFTKEGSITACCGGGGQYNYNSSAQCGSEAASVCDDPTKYVSWDGVHLTEAAYRVIAHGLLEGPYTTPHIATLCALDM